MAIIRTLVSAANNNRSTIFVTYNDVNNNVSLVEWNNPEGWWKITLTVPPNPPQVFRLNPGDSGSTNPGGQWGHLKTDVPTLQVADVWSRVAPPA